MRPFRMKLISAAFTGLLAIATLPGCAKQLATADRSGNRSTDRRPRQLEKIPPRGLDFVIRDRRSVGEVSVQLAVSPEVSKAWPDGFFAGLAEGGAAGAVGVGTALLFPMYQGAALGVLLVPPLAVWGYANSRQNATVTKALQDIDFPNRLQASLDSRFFKNSRPAPAGDLRLEVGIIRYGLLNNVPGGEILCLKVDATIVLTASDGVIFEDDVFWSHLTRSEDLPPARCASLGKFAAKDGALVQQVFDEASEIVSAAIFRRLGGKP